jgi:hypothetical protein
MVAHTSKLFAVVNRAVLYGRNSLFISDVMKAVFCFMSGNSSVERHGFSMFLMQKWI